MELLVGQTRQSTQGNLVELLAGEAPVLILSAGMIAGRREEK
jgi:hypothetical protein